MKNREIPILHKIRRVCPGIYPERLRCLCLNEAERESDP
jgi:hypothetical protein